MNPADSSQQCHSAKQAASISETTWYVQQQRGVADYTCSPPSWHVLISCFISRAIYYCRCQPRPSSRGGVGHTWPVPHLELYTRLWMSNKKWMSKRLLTNLSFISDIFWWSHDFGTHWDYFGWADSQSNWCKTKGVLSLVKYACESILSIPQRTLAIECNKISDEAVKTHWNGKLNT